MRQVFVDLDGVMADFDGHYEALFHKKIDRNRPKDSAADRELWRNVSTVPTFFRDLPVLPGAKALWSGLHKLGVKPIVLTGGSSKLHTTAEQKTEWVHEHIDPTAKVIVTESRNKFEHGEPGDILIDDWKRYMPNWVNMGGVFILYTGDVADTLHQVEKLLRKDA